MTASRIAVCSLIGFAASIGAVPPAAADWDAAVAAYKEQRWQEASQLFAEVARQSPGAASAHYMLGASLLQAERPQEAIASLTEAVALEGSPQQRIALARAQVGAERSREAVATLATIAPDALPVALVEGYGKLLAAAASRAPGADSTRLLEERAPKLQQAPVWTALARCHEDDGRLLAAARALERSFGLEASPATARRAAALLLAHAEERGGERLATLAREAAVLADRADAPGDSESPLLAARAWERAGDLGVAVLRIRLALERDPTRHAARLDLAQLLTRQGQPEVARRELEQLPQAAAEQLGSGFWRARAVAAHQLGDLAPAAADYRRAGDVALATQLEAAVADSNRRREELARCEARLAELEEVWRDNQVLRGTDEGTQLETRLAAVRLECAELALDLSAAPG